MVTNAGQWTFLAVDKAVGRSTTDCLDVDSHEAIEHIAGAPGVVKGNHVTGVVEDDVCEVTRLLPCPSSFALEHPILFSILYTGGSFETLATVPLHVPNHSFCTNVIANKVLVTREQQDWNLLDDFGQELDSRLALSGTEMTRNGPVALLPAGLLIGVDVKCLDNIGAAEVRSDLRKIRRPVHTTRRIVTETDIVHVQALVHVVGLCVFGLLQNPNHDLLTLACVDSVHSTSVELLDADPLLFLHTPCHVRISPHETILVGKGYVSEILVDGRYPTVSNHESLERPWRFGGVLFVSIEDSTTDVGDVLTSVRFTGDVQLRHVSIPASPLSQATHIVILVFGE